MSTLARSMIVLDTQMDEILNLEILLLLKSIEKISSHCLGFKFKQTQNSREWLIVFVWRDAASMQDHFSSKSLQVLLNLLVSRCSIVSFEEVSNAAARGGAGSA